jgi:hypothetical protein
MGDDLQLVHLKDFDAVQWMDRDHLGKAGHTA